MLRLLDACTGSRAEVRLARPGVLRVCAHMPQAATGSGLTALRMLLIADLLARTAELGGLQVLTVVTIGDPAAGWAEALPDDAGALGIHPPTARAAPGDAPSALGGPIDVHLVSGDASPDHGPDGLTACVGAAHLGAGRAGGGQPGGHGHDPLAVRLALMSFPGHLPADLTGDLLDRAGATLASWRHQVAHWAESPSRPVPVPVAEAVRAAFSDLDTVSTLGLLGGLAQDASVPAGTKFETFVYADRILGLDLAREVGR